MVTETDTEGSPGIDLDQIVEKLDAARRKLPEQAIRDARRHRDLMVPRLIEVVRGASADARAGDTPEGNAHLCMVSPELKVIIVLAAPEPAWPGTVGNPSGVCTTIGGEALTSVVPQPAENYGENGISGRPGRFFSRAH